MQKSWVVPFIYMHLGPIETHLHFLTFMLEAFENSYTSKIKEPFFSWKKCRPKFWMTNRTLAFRKTDSKRELCSHMNSHGSKIMLRLMKVEKAKALSPNRQTRSFFLLPETFLTFYFTNEGQVMRLNTKGSVTSDVLLLFHNFHYFEVFFFLSHKAKSWHIKTTFIVCLNSFAV